MQLLWQTILETVYLLCSCFKLLCCSESLLCTVLEGRMERTRTRGRKTDTMIDWMKSNDVEYDHIKKRPHDREDRVIGGIDLPEKAEHSRERERLQLQRILFLFTYAKIEYVSVCTYPSKNRICTLRILEPCTSNTSCDNTLRRLRLSRNSWPRAVVSYLFHDLLLSLVSHHSVSSRLT